LHSFWRIDEGFEQAPTTFMAQTQADVRRRDTARSAFRPFDQADCAVIEILAKTRIEKLLW